MTASGGEPVILTKLPSTETAHYWPYFLPDGRHYLFTVRSSIQGHRNLRFLARCSRTSAASQRGSGRTGVEPVG